MISSGLALYYQLSGSTFDPIEKIQTLQSQNRRGEAHDLAKFLIENNTGDVERIKEIESTLEYSKRQKNRIYS